MKTLLLVFSLSYLLPLSSYAATALFLSEEFQSLSGGNAGSIRGGDPASSTSFSNFLGTAALTSSDVVSDLTIAGQYAVWANISDPGGVTSSNIDFGGISVGISISGWSNITNSRVGASGSALIDGFGSNSSSLQAGAPRPAFASGSGSGVYIGTTGGSSSDDIRNAVTFDLSSFAGGGAFSFGVFGGDLETGSLNSPSGLLFVEFTNGDTETIDYTPDSSLFPDASFSSSGNNESETFGNETGRFIGIADDSRRIESVTFVVGDDDQNDDGDSEQLSFIAPVIFLDFDGTSVTPLVPTQIPIPEPHSFIFLAAVSLATLFRRSR